ncbi:MAG TPA: PH domain-containing protein [Beutenbergiaceae bacterium]|nr:PH domain-containing protein [Beutenbergiaceae bacterium]
MGTTHNFRTTFAQVLTVAAGALILLAGGFSLYEGGTAALWQTLPFLAVGGGLVWVLFGNPKVEVSDGGVTVVNVVRQVHVPWPTLRGVDTRWSLSVETTAGTFSSWAIPAASGMSMRMRNPRPQGDRLQSDDTVRSLSTGANADAVALVIAERLESLTNAGHLNQDTLGQVTPQISWNTRELVVLGVVAVLVLFLVL